MGNIKNFNFNKLDLKLSNSDYWDFYLATDEGPAQPCYGLSSGDCFVVWYDFNNPSIYPNSATTASTIYSLVTWTGATNSGYTMNTIGLTGIDNGLVEFDKVSGDTSNQALLQALTGSTLIIPSGDTRMFMHKVTGTTGNFIYPVDYVIDPTFTTGDYMSFCGGFYQGFYKLDGNDYQVLPVRVPNAWAAEFWLNPSSSGCTGYTGTTLNDIYPDNKGFFFYIGTRAENKFWTVFSGIDSGCTSNCTQDSGCTGTTIGTWCTVTKEDDVTLVGDYGVGISLAPPPVEIEIVTNQFLIYGRSYDGSVGKFSESADTYVISTASTESQLVSNSPPCSDCDDDPFDGLDGVFGDSVCGRNTDGLGSRIVCNYDGNGVVVVKTSEVKTNFTNPFLIYGRGSGITGSGSTGCRTCQGPRDGYGSETIGSFTGITSPEFILDVDLDIIDNALGFRIKDDGSIGYRLLTVTGQCVNTPTGDKFVSGVTINEAYSMSGIVSANTWSYIAIRFVTEYKDECELKVTKPRTGKLMFYVNAKLKFVVPEFPEIVAKRLAEYKSKQVGVPFNFSIGGGSQGLLESQTFDGQDPSDIGLPIETNFAGTFIGAISQFKFNICNLTFCDIQYNYSLDTSRYNATDTNLIISDSGFILQDNGYGIMWV
jgi:hypothetical protein